MQLLPVPSARRPIRFQRALVIHRGHAVTHPSCPMTMIDHWRAARQQQQQQQLADSDRVMRWVELTHRHLHYLRAEPARQDQCLSVTLSIVALSVAPALFACKLISSPPPPEKLSIIQIQLRVWRGQRLSQRGRFKLQIQRLRFVLRFWRYIIFLMYARVYLVAVLTNFAIII